MCDLEEIAREQILCWFCPRDCWLLGSIMAFDASRFFGLEFFASVPRLKDILRLNVIYGLRYDIITPRCHEEHPK